MLFFAIVSCASSNEEEQVPNDLSDTTAEQQVSSNDSMPKPKPVPPPPPPGSARVKGEIITVDTSKNGQNLIIHFKIHQTLAYGSSTPSIAPQDTLEISASRGYSVQQNDTLTAEIRYREPLAISGDSGLKWSLVNVEQNVNQK